MLRVATAGTGNRCVLLGYPLTPKKFIKSVGEEYQVVKRRRECNGCGEENNVEIRERGNNIIFPIILRLFTGRILSGENRKGTEIFGKMGVGKNIKLYGALYAPETRKTRIWQGRSYPWSWAGSPQ